MSLIPQGVHRSRRQLEEAIARRVESNVRQCETLLWRLRPWTALQQVWFALT